MDITNKEVIIDSKTVQLRQNKSPGVHHKKAMRYFDRRKQSMKKKLIKSSLQLPSTKAHKAAELEVSRSLNTKTEMSRKSAIQSSLNVRTSNNKSTMSINQRFKNQIFSRKESRNHPYNPFPEISTSSGGYSPLIKGIKGTQNVYSNSYCHIRDRSDQSSLSSFTNSRNIIANLEMQKFKRASEERVVKDVAERGAIDGLIKNTQKQLKCLSYKLSTVISDGNYHNLLEEGQMTRIEVIEDTLIYCKIGLKYKYSPMTIK